MTENYVEGYDELELSSDEIYAVAGPRSRSRRMPPERKPLVTVTTVRDTPPPMKFGPVHTAAIALSVIGTPLAMGLSYQRNKSVPLSLLHGLLGPIYVAYRGAQYVGKGL